jgi:hypothetical protein
MPSQKLRVVTSMPLDRVVNRVTSHSKDYLLDMAGYGNESERWANGANQSANGGRWRRSTGCQARWRPGPTRGGKGGRAATREPDRAAQATASETLRSPRLVRRLVKRHIITTE